MATNLTLLIITVLLTTVLGASLPPTWANSSSHFVQESKVSFTNKPFYLKTQVTKGNLTFDGLYITSVRVKNAPSVEVAICAKNNISAELFEMRDTYVVSKYNPVNTLGLPFLVQTSMDGPADNGAYDVTICHEPTCLQTRGFIVDVHQHLRFFEGVLTPPWPTNACGAFGDFIVCHARRGAKYSWMSVHKLGWRAEKLCDCDTGECEEDQVPRTRAANNGSDEVEWLKKCAIVDLKAEYVEIDHETH